MAEQWKSMKRSLRDEKKSLKAHSREKEPVRGGTKKTWESDHSSIAKPPQSKLLLYTMGG